MERLASAQARKAGGADEGAVEELKRMELENAWGERRTGVDRRATGRGRPAHARLKLVLLRQCPPAFRVSARLRQGACLGGVRRRRPRPAATGSAWPDIAQPLVRAGLRGQAMRGQRGRQTGLQGLQALQGPAPVRPASASAMAWPRRGAAEPSSASNRFVVAHDGRPVGAGRSRRLWHVQPRCRPAGASATSAAPLRGLQVGQAHAHHAGIPAVTRLAGQQHDVARLRPAGR
jgi:hypothetical protein